MFESLKSKVLLLVLLLALLLTVQHGDEAVVYGLNNFASVILGDVVTTTKGHNARCMVDSIPTRVTAGELFKAKITVTNTGTIGLKSRWNSIYTPLQNPYLLKAVDTVDNQWGVLQDGTFFYDRIYIPSDVEVGQSFTLELSIKAPPYDAKNSMPEFAWQMAQENIEYFGGICETRIVVDAPLVISPASPTPAESIPSADALGPTATPQLLANDAACQWFEIPDRVSRGKSFSASVAVRNIGIQNWKGISLNPYKLGSQDPENTKRWGVNRVLVKGYIPPGETSVFSFKAKSPAVPGAYSFSWQMIQGTNGWFGEKCSYKIIVE